MRGASRAGRAEGADRRRTRGRLAAGVLVLVGAGFVAGCASTAREATSTGASEVTTTTTLALATSTTVAAVASLPPSTVVPSTVAAPPPSTVVESTTASLPVTGPTDVPPTTVVESTTASLPVTGSTDAPPTTAEATTTTAGLPYTGPTEAPPTTDHLSAAKWAQQAATDKGFIQVTLPGRMEAEHTALVTARIYPPGAPAESAPPGTSLTPRQIPIAPFMAVVLEGDGITVTPDDSHDLVHARRRLLLIGDQHTDWQWRITPHRTSVSPLSTETDHLYFHVYFFENAADTIGVEVTPPQERSLTVAVNPGHSLLHGLGAFWGWLGVTGVVAIGMVWGFFKKVLPWWRRRRAPSPAAEPEPAASGAPGHAPRPATARRPHKKPRQRSPH